MTTDPKAPLPDVEAGKQALLKLYGADLSQEELCAWHVVDGLVTSLRAHIATQAEKIAALEALEQRLREQLADRFNRDWCDAQEAVNKALEDYFTKQRKDIMEALAQPAEPDKEREK